MSATGKRDWVQPTNLTAVDMRKSVWEWTMPLYNLDNLANGWVDLAKDFARSDTGHLPALHSLGAAGVSDAHACIVGDPRHNGAALPH